MYPFLEISFIKKSEYGASIATADNIPSFLMRPLLPLLMDYDIILSNVLYIKM